MSSPCMNMRAYIGEESGSQLVPDPSRLMGSERLTDDCIVDCIVMSWCSCWSWPGECAAFSVFGVGRWAFSVLGFALGLTGTRVIPHFGHVPGWSVTTSGCMTHV